MAVSNLTIDPAALDFSSFTSSSLIADIGNLGGELFNNGINLDAAMNKAGAVVAGLSEQFKNLVVSTADHASKTPAAAGTGISTGPIQLR